MANRFSCLIMGAAGRDFHDFQTFFRAHPEFVVRAFTATQIPFIDQRSFPHELAGPDYADDIPIFSEERLEELIERFKVDFVFLSYSDLPHEVVMHKASRVQAAGASFALLGPGQTQLQSRRPVVAVTAVRTGCGKSPLSQHLTAHLRDKGVRTGVIRHPMPYGDLRKQAVQRFASVEDLTRHQCTIEEREEYEPYVAQGLVIFAGVDYASILKAAEDESDLVLWDGGNNDTPFIRPDLWLVVADALRAGHEVGFYPGETNLRSADVVLINKVSGARPEDVETVRANIAAANPRAEIVESDLDIELTDPEQVRGRKVLVVEDGPTVTHGGMAYGAGLVAAERAGAGELVDPRPAAVGTLAETFKKYPHLERVLPAMGYSDAQLADLTETIHRSGAEVVVDASPGRLDRVLKLEVPLVRARYRFHQLTGKPLTERVDALLAERAEKKGG